MKGKTMRGDAIRREEQVIDDFVLACHPTPTEEQVRDWQGRHPNQARLIARVAKGMRDGSRRSEEVRRERPGSAIAETLLLVMEHLHEAGAPAAVDLPGLVHAAGLTIPGLARTIDIDRSVLADLVAGRLRPATVPRRLTSALADALRTGADVVADAIRASFASPRLGHASSDGPFAISHRSYAEAVAASTMTSERKAYWMGGD